MFITDIHKDKNDFLIEGKRNKTSIEKCEFILWSIYKQIYCKTNKDKIEERLEKGVSLNAELLKLVIGKDYINYINHLIDKNIIKQVSGYTVGVNSKQFILCNFKNNSKNIKNNITNKYYLKYYELERNKSTDIISSVNQTTADKIYVAEQMSSFLNESVSFGDNKSVKNILNNNFYNRHYYYSQKTLVDTISNAYNLVELDKHEARMFGAHSNLSSTIRKYLTFNGNYTLSLDIKNSQWQFLCLEMYDHYKHHSDFISFSNLCQSGRIYEYFTEKLNNVYSRDFIKKHLLHYLYAHLDKKLNIKVKQESRDIINKINFVFKTEFKTVYNYIKSQKMECGKKGSSKFAIRLQTKECNVISFIQKILFKKNINTLSVHDSIIIEKYKDDEDKTLDVINFIIEELRNIGISREGIKIINNEIEIEKDLIKNKIKVINKKIEINSNSKKSKQEILEKEIRDERTKKVLKEMKQESEKDLGIDFKLDLGLKTETEKVKKSGLGLGLGVNNNKEIYTHDDTFESNYNNKSESIHTQKENKFEKISFFDDDLNNYYEKLKKRVNYQNF